MTSTATAGCFTIVSNNDGEILLVKRKDYPVWDLPGGRVEKHEDLIKCAIRETKEETGYIISIEAKIGEYFQTQFNDIQHIYSGKLSGGEALVNGPETAKVGWCNPKRLPLFMVPNRRKQIKTFFRNKDKLVKGTLYIPFLIRVLTKTTNDLKD